MNSLREKPYVSVKTLFVKRGNTFFKRGFTFFKRENTFLSGIIETHFFLYIICLFLYIIF